MLNKQALLQAYRKMREIRTFEERLHQENTSGDIPGFIHLYTGEEAIAVGVCENLTNADFIGSTHRGHGHCIAKGCDIHGMMAEIFGKDSGLCRGKGGSMHIADLSKGMLGANAIVGGAPPLAIGAALTAKTLKTGNVGVSFTGDGGSNQGLVFEAINMAVVLQLPAIFIFENNGYGEGTGHDYAVFEGDPALYRAEGEVQRLREQHDPLKIFTARVKQHISLEELAAIDAEVEALVDDAVFKARAAAYPAPEDLLTDVYVSY